MNKVLDRVFCFLTKLHKYSIRLRKYCGWNVIAFYGAPLALAAMFCLHDTAKGSAALALTLLFIVSTLTIITEKHVFVVEFLGQYWRTWEPGIHIFIPGIMVVRNRLYVGDQLLQLKLDAFIDENGAQCGTPDSDGRLHSLMEVKNDSVALDAEFTIRVDIERWPDAAYRATYNVRGENGDYIAAIMAAVEAGLRSEFGKHDLNEVIQKTDQYRASVEKHYQRDIFNGWGVDFLQLFIKDIRLLPVTIAERRKRLEAGVDKEAMILRAEGEKEALLLKGEGEGMRIQNAAEKSGIKDPMLIAAIHLAEAQFGALKEATVFINTGSEGLNIAPVAAQAQAVLDRIRKPKEA